MQLRQALRAAGEISIPSESIAGCVGTDAADQLFDRARRSGLSALALNQRRGLNRVTGEVAESVAEILLAEIGLSVFWHLTTPGAHGVDLLFLGPDESVLALEVKGTLRRGAIPRLTPSRLRQMSREWLNGPDNPAMGEWALEADDLYAGAIVIDLISATARMAVSEDFDTFVGVDALEQLQHLSGLFNVET
jgi:hypothetical protein